MTSDESSPRPPDVSRLLDAGIGAARSGHPGWARDLFIRAIELDGTCVSAWLWLAEIEASPEERARCLARARTLDPHGRVTIQRLDLQGAGHVPSAPPALPNAEPRQVPDPERRRPWARTKLEPLGPGDTGGNGGTPPPDLPPAEASVSGVESPAAHRRTIPPALDVDRLLQQGIDAVYARQTVRARELLARVVEIDERHMSAWLWLSYVSDTQAERDRCVARVLKLAGQTGTPSPAPAAAPDSLRPTSAAAPVAAPEPPASSLIKTPHALAVQAITQPAYAGATAGPGGYAPPDTPLVRSLAVEASVASILVRGAVSEWASTWGLIALAYLAAITFAEVLTTFASPQWGLVAHSMILLVLLVHSAQIAGRKERALVLSLAFAPLIRILSLSLPLVDFPLLYWYLITSLPLFAGAAVAARSLSYTWLDLGLTLRGWPLQIAIGLAGLIFGCVEYLILRPDALVPDPGWRSLALAALILSVSTGLLEELIFRGLLQRAAGEVLGRWGLTYVALLFAVLHVGYKSAADLIFVFVVGLFLGWIVHRTRSLLGVILAHGLTNVVLFLIMPLLQH